MSSKSRKFVQLTDKAERALNSKADDETIYEFVFQEIMPAIKETGISVEWHDPDSTYRQDAEAYVRALSHKAENLQHILDAIDSGDE